MKKRVACLRTLRDLPCAQRTACAVTLIAVLVATIMSPAAAIASREMLTEEIQSKLAVGAVAPGTRSPSPVIEEAAPVTYGSITWVEVPALPQPPLRESGAAALANGELAVVITDAPRVAPGAAISNGVVISGLRTNTVGDLWVLNRANRTVQPFTPPNGNAWLVVVTNLVEGLNRVGVYGQAADGSKTGDGVSIWVGDRYASPPEVHYSGPDFVALSNDVTSVLISGFHNEHVRGEIRWYNAKNWDTGFAATGVVDQGDWSVVVSNLDVGRNPIYVLASNAYGDTAFDLKTVTRAERADAAYVAITGAPDYVVSEVSTSATISGVQSNIQGSMWWHVDTLDTSGFFMPGQGDRWAVTVPLAVGTNRVVVSGRDATGERDSDEVTIRVGKAMFKNSARITINATSPLTVPYETASLNMSAYTANPSARSVTWTNPTTQASGAMSPDANGTWWHATVEPLAVGYNRVYVDMVDVAGRTDSDLLVVVRQPRENLPYVEITGAPESVGYDVKTAPVTGTNNHHVVDAMAWSNITTGVRGICSRGGQELTFTASVTPLAYGENTILVIVSNKWGDIDWDVVSVSRDAYPFVPALAVTSSVPEEVAYAVKRIALHGTNNPAVAFAPQWVNIDGAETGTVDWADSTWSCIVRLVPGMNTIFLTASNKTGQTASDVVNVFRSVSPGDPVVRITGYVPTNVPPETDFLMLDGTNNAFVTGPMRWVNAYAQTTGTFARTGNAWSCRVEPLAEGMNVIYVLASNAMGRVGLDAVSVERLRPGGDPVVAITNSPPETVGHDTSEVTLAGTNTADIVGDLVWENFFGETKGLVPSSRDGRWWVTVSNLVYGGNNIYVSGRDAYGNEANDVVSVFREFPPWVRYVHAGGADQYPYTNWSQAASSIQRAVDASSDGDIVIVGEGTYAVGRRFVDGEQTMNRVVIDGPVRVESAGDPGKTVILGEWDGGLNAVRCASVSGGGALVGFTLKNGRAEGFGRVQDGNGGGARVRGGSIIGCRVAGNFATGEGGGLAVEDGGLVEDTVILSNGAAGAGGGLLLGESRLVSSLVGGNTAMQGGGILLRDGEISRSRIVGNTAEWGEGGGVLVLPGAGPSLDNSLLAGNDAAAAGGAVAAHGACQIVHCTVADNEADVGSGGVIAAEPSGLRRTILAGNRLLGGEQDPQFAGGFQPIECLLPDAPPGNIPGEPKFRGDTDYHLVEGSLGIDAFPGAGGRNVHTLASAAEQDVDLDGVPRPLDGTGDGQALPDAGAYEFLNPASDTDGDGLLDGWEHEFGLSPVSPEGDDGATGDPDGDGLDNTGEYRADTDPGDAGSVLRIVAVEPEGDQVLVVVQGGVNATRTLVASPILEEDGAPSWIEADSAPAPTTVTNVLIHSGAMGTPQYYRVRARRP